MTQCLLVNPSRLICYLPAVDGLCLFLIIVFYVYINESHPVQCSYIWMKCAIFLEIHTSLSYLSDIDPSYLLVVNWSFFLFFLPPDTQLGQTILPFKEDFLVVQFQYVCMHCHEVIANGKRWFCTECKKFQECERWW